MAVAAWREPGGMMAAAAISGRKGRKVMLDVRGGKAVLNGVNIDVYDWLDVEFSAVAGDGDR
jgi:hypothetical protein